MRIIGIYKITSPSGRVYVGQSNNIERRKRSYQKVKELDRQRKLLNSISKYGWDAHSFEILELCDEGSLNERERFWQEQFDCIKHGLNCVLTKTTDRSGVLSEETKRRISASMTGKPKSLEAKAKQSATRTGRPGHQFTPEQRKQISERQIGKKHSSERIEKMRSSLKGRKPNNVKPVINESTNEVYTDILDASNKTGINYTVLYNMLTGRTTNKTNLRLLSPTSP